MSGRDLTDLDVFQGHINEVAVYNRSAAHLIMLRTALIQKDSFMLLYLYEFRFI